MSERTQYDELVMVRDVDTHVLEEIITTRRHGTPPVPTWQLSPEDLEILLDAGEPVKNVPDSFSAQGQEVLSVEAEGDHFKVKVKRSK